MKSFKQVMEKVYTSDYVLNKDGRKVHRKELVDKESGEDVKKEGYYGGKYRSAAWHADGGANDERHDLDTPRSKPADHPHAVHINGKKWKSFGSQSHAQNVANKIKGATVHKEEVELEEALDPSEIASNPRMYNAADAKKAYYHKNASASDKESLARHLDRHHGNKEWRKPVKEELDEESSEYEKSEENKRSADAAKKQGNMFDHHLHMADHHENLARWHASRGRHGEADKHSEKADAHHEKAMALKEETIDEATPYYNKQSFLKKMSHAAKQERLAREKKEKENQSKQVKEDSMLGFKDLVEKMNLAKANMGDVIKDFQKSDAPQFAGKSDEKKRQMAIAAKLEAERGVKEELKGNQHKIDKNKNGKVDAHDFKLLRKEEEEVDEKFDPLKHVKNPTPGEKKAAKDVKRSSYADRAAMLRSAQADGRLKEEEMEEQAPVAPSLGVHRVSVTTSEPDHPMVSKRKETTQRFVKVTTNSKERAIEQGMKHFKKKGFKVHSAEHVGMMHEEVESIDEANHREFAQAGKMHPDMAKHMKTGQEIDFYHSKTGDKISGKVTKNDGKAVHIQANKGGKVGGGETHKFAVSKNLGGQMHEGVDMPMTYKEFMEALWPGTPEYEKKFPKRVTGAGARHDIVDTGKGVRATRRFNDNDTAEAPKNQEKRGRGRPAGSKSGANQKVTTKSDESGGMATHSLRLPSR